MSLLTILTSNAWNILNFYQSFFLWCLSRYFFCCVIAPPSKSGTGSSTHCITYISIEVKVIFILVIELAHIFLPELKHILAYNKKSIFDGITVKLSFHYKSDFAKTRVLTLTLGLKLRKSGQFFNLNT